MISNAPFDFDPPGDAVIEERVRAELGRVAEHPASIRVTASDGLVILDGSAQVHERRAIVDAIEQLTGVDDVHDRLELRESSAGVPGPQATARRTRSAPELARWYGSPATRAALGFAGAAAVGYGARRRDLLGDLLCVAGVALLVRAAIRPAAGADRSSAGLATPMEERWRAGAGPPRAASPPARRPACPPSPSARHAGR
jgi:hypothetical protein